MHTYIVCDVIIRRSSISRPFKLCRNLLYGRVNVTAMYHRVDRNTPTTWQ